MLHHNGSSYTALVFRALTIKEYQIVLTARRVERLKSSQ